MAGKVATEVMPDPSGVGSVILDIGGDIGAAAVFVPASLAGLEIEIRRDGEPWEGRHVAVRERQLPDAAVWAALFPSLEAGDYEIRVRHADPDGPTTHFTVAGGRVATVYWPDVDRSGAASGGLGRGA
jgi:hypothetical protein